MQSGSTRAGRDATEAFEDVGHSDEAREILDKHYAGEGPAVRLFSCPPKSLPRHHSDRQADVGRARTGHGKGP